MACKIVAFLYRSNSPGQKNSANEPQRIKIFTKLTILYRAETDVIEKHKNEKNYVSMVRI